MLFLQKIGTMNYHHILRASMMLVTVAMVLFTSCKKDPDPDPDVPQDIIILNKWIMDVMSDVYLWEEFIPPLNPNKEPDPKEYFYKLLYTEDRDSWISDDSEEHMASFDGVETTTGMSANPGLITETQIISIVEYVTPDSPAEDSGVVRGDIIMTINGQSLTVDNYRDLYTQSTATFEFGNWDGVSMQSNGKEVTLARVVLNQNPVVHSEIIDYQGQKIGYFVYTQFTSGQTDEWLIELNNVFDNFKSAGVSDVILDLRYNGGGYLDISAHMASTLGKVTAMQNNEVYLKFVWNDGYNEYWKGQDLDQDGHADGDDSEQLVIRLPDCDCNLNLSRVYFLTTERTASASESLMVGLYPYSDVVQIGTKTYGKCYASFTFEDTHEPKRHTWALQPIVLKYANANGYTDFVTGITPDYFVEEYLLDLEQFGSFNDPFLAKALEDITGIAPVAKKSVRPEVDFHLLPRPRKRVPERIMDWPDKSGKRVLF